MMTAKEARKIADSKVKSEHDSFCFKYAIDQIERNVKDASSRGGRSFSLNVNALAPGYDKPELHLRKAVAEELKKNGFSYCETQRSPNCVWFKELSMTTTKRRISTWTMIRLCWSLKHLTIWQKMKWSIGFVENVWRSKLGLEIKPVLIWK